MGQKWAASNQPWSNAKLTEEAKALNQKMALVSKMVCDAYQVESLEDIEVDDQGDLVAKPTDDPEKA